MSKSNEYVEAAAALIRTNAEAQRGVGDTYGALGEVKAAVRAMGIASHMERAAELLREDANPKYDAKAAAASHLAGAVFRYLTYGGGDQYLQDMDDALTAYDAIDDGKD